MCWLSESRWRSVEKKDLGKVFGWTQTEMVRKLTFGLSVAESAGFCCYYTSPCPEPKFWFASADRAVLPLRSEFLGVTLPGDQEFHSFIWQTNPLLVLLKWLLWLQSCASCALNVVLHCIDCADCTGLLVGYNLKGSLHRRFVWLCPSLLVSVLPCLRTLQSWNRHWQQSAIPTLEV